ncbi:DUF4421 domain-containing protein [Tamlana agarivorans]|uniref:DUF4421 domain-containing protein n=1 Tax=Pseudotamlana agarivorans TaxID=481183 RepID=A0ACC5U6A5_9FLAO|nr:DUF4421 family protein [Tamlana agarivorans]MBU2949774.1 DUF4421 domain-containing protein [Tamlana agarivorans]
MDFKLKLLGILLNFLCLPLFAQNNNTSKTAQDSIQDVVYGEQHNEYIYIYKNRITAKAYFIKTSNTLRIRNREDANDEFHLFPNNQDKIGASVAFRSISASYSFSPNSLAENPNDNNSKLFNLNLRSYFGKHFMQTLDIYSQKGFQLEGTNNQQAYLPKTKSFKIGGSTSYIFNENFSYRAIATQDEKQLKSAGTFMPRLVYYFTKHDVHVTSEDGSQSISTDYNALDIAFAPSYIYNFVPTKNLFLSAGVSAGIGLNYSNNPGDEENMTSLLTELDFRGSITYDINFLYLGAHYNYLILNHNSDRSSYIKDDIPYLQVFIGYRFNAPKKMVNKADEINKKISF